ncbi:MAG: hypothetical protein HY860_00505 [Chlamydiales bacterium]|nr:hypothetical protein [Chlamydiales bacterium]
MDLSITATRPFSENPLQPLLTTGSLSARIPCDPTLARDKNELQSLARRVSTIVQTLICTRNGADFRPHHLVIIQTNLGTYKKELAWIASHLIEMDTRYSTIKCILGLSGLIQTTTELGGIIDSCHKTLGVFLSHV